MTGASGDRETAGVIAPPPLIAAATVGLALVLDRLLPLSAMQALLSFWPRVIVGGALIAAGGALALAAERRFKAAGTDVRPWRPTTALATGGVYAYVRNPMYVGLVLLVVGLSVALASDWTLLGVAPMAALLHYGVVLREEAYLERKFGNEYRRYKDSVPRYGLPR